MLGFRFICPLAVVLLTHPALAAKQRLHAPAFFYLCQARYLKGPGACLSFWPVPVPRNADKSRH